jgi:uncharacterized protein YraI
MRNRFMQRWVIGAAAVAAWLLTPSAAFAQASGIAGVARDTRSGS